jgi:alkanesulfonate monooxygenase SsuD/methylene tetrahydromethanopterin reductase-like flavin-dependent oxidoreductase (luciferase family)
VSTGSNEKLALVLPTWTCLGFTCLMGRLLAASHAGLIVRGRWNEKDIMKIGLSAIGFGTLAAPALIRTVVTSAERLNFSTAWAPEHVVLLDRYNSHYPYSVGSSGEFLAPTDISINDPFPTLTFAAACTSRIRLATGICLVPEHNPLVLAKTVATVDYLSGGRVILGVGIGWLAEEFQALGTLPYTIAP